MDRKRVSLFYPKSSISKSNIPKSGISGKKPFEVSASRSRSLFSPDHDDEIQKMRDAAFKAEIRKYFQAEAKVLFKQQIQNIAKQEGTSVEEIMKPSEEPRDFAEKAGFAVHAVGVTLNALISLPYLIILLALQGLVIFLPIAFIYKMITGFK